MTKIRIVSRCAVLAVVLCAAAASAPAQEQQGELQMTPEMEAEMAAWMQLAQPGEHHEHLAPFAGRWKGEVSMWMAPDAAPMVNKSTSEASWVMEGRFLEWKHHGELGGMPFEGRAIEAYNNGTKRYESVWFDNFGTLILFFTGSCSDSGASREMTTSFEDVVAGGTIIYTTVTTLVDADHFTYTAYMDKGDGPFKNMEIRYTRQ